MEPSHASLPLALDPRAGEPPYAQIRDGIVRLADAGQLVPGDRLPPVRRLAAQLEVAPNTVARAYRELEQAGVVVTQGRRGTVLALDADRARRTAFLAACAYLDQVEALGLDAAEATALLERAAARYRQA